MSPPAPPGARRVRRGARRAQPIRRRPLFAARVLVVCALAACGGDEAPGRGAGPPEGGPPPPAVEVVTLTPEAFHETAALLGELRAVESVVIKSEMAGVIERIAFEEGQPVAKGTVLFELRDDERLARLHEAEAQLALAQDEFERTRLLASRNAAAEVQLARDRAELAVAQARLERYRAEWERTRIRAPFDGLVGARQVSPGARITPEDPLVRIDAVDPVELVFTIPEAVLPLARIGSPFELKVASYPERWFPGTLSFIAPSVDSQTRRVLLKGRVPNPGHTLLPGMFAEVRAALEEREAFLVPEEALGTDPDGFFVWRIGPDDGAERVPVEVGARDSGRVEIRAELRPGDRIVSAGTHKVRAGEKVRPVAAAVAPGGTPASSAASVPRSGA